MAGRQTWASTLPLQHRQPSSLPGASHHVCCLYCFSVSSFCLLTAPFSLDKTLRSVCEPFLCRRVSIKCCVLLLSTCLMLAASRVASAERYPQVFAKASVLSSHSVWLLSGQPCKSLTFGRVAVILRLEWHCLVFLVAKAELLFLLLLSVLQHPRAGLRLEVFQRQDA